MTAPNPIPTQQETLERFVLDKSDCVDGGDGCKAEMRHSIAGAFVYHSEIEKARAAVAGPPGDASTTARNRDEAQDIIMAFEEALGQCYDAATRHDLASRITEALDAATSSPTESVPTAWTKKWPKVNGGVYWRRYLGYEQPTQPEICILHGSYLDDFNGKSIMSIPSQGLSEEWEFFGPITAPPERTRVAGERNEMAHDTIPWDAIQKHAGTDVMTIAMDAKANRLSASGLMEAIASYAKSAYVIARGLLADRIAEKLKPYFTNDVDAAKRAGVQPATVAIIAALIQCELPTNTSDSARLAAEEIVQRVYGGDKDEFGELEGIVAATISKHFTTPADNDAESLLQHVAYSGVEFDDNRMGYVVVQIDRDVWEQIQKLAPTTKGDR